MVEKWRYVKLVKKLYTSAEQDIKGMEKELSAIEAAILKDRSKTGNESLLKELSILDGHARQLKVRIERDKLNLETIRESISFLNKKTRKEKKERKATRKLTMVK